MRDAGWVREPIVLTDDELWSLTDAERDELEALLAAPMARGEVWRTDGFGGTRVEIRDRAVVTDLAGPDN